jgi:hypothetical protein
LQSIISRILQRNLLSSLENYRMPSFSAKEAGVAPALAMGVAAAAMKAGEKGLLYLLVGGAMKVHHLEGVVGTEAGDGKPQRSLRPTGTSTRSIIMIPTRSE